MKRVNTIEVSWKFQRKARTYRRIYASLGNSKEPLAFEVIEKMQKQFKTHRNIEEIENRYRSKVLTELN